MNQKLELLIDKLAHLEKMGKNCDVRFIAKDALKIARELESELDEHCCADCGKAFASGDERDEHFMSPACPKYSPLVWR